MTDAPHDKALKELDAKLETAFKNIMARHGGTLGTAAVFGGIILVVWLASTVSDMWRYITPSQQITLIIVGVLQLNVIAGVCLWWFRKRP